jgi:hypothetical protein
MLPSVIGGPGGLPIGSRSVAFAQSDQHRALDPPPRFNGGYATVLNNHQ